MALFKILSNMDNTSKSLPNTYNKGYCYFDVNTKKFWIDTTDTASGRVAINAPRADIAQLATQIPFGTCTTAANSGDKTIVLDSIPWLETTPSAGDVITAPPVGTIIAVYFENTNTIANATAHLKYSANTAASTSHAIYLNYPSNAVGATKSKSWTGGSIVFFTYIVSSNTGIWVISSGSGGGSNYTFAEGSTNGAFSVTPEDGSAQSVPIHGLGTAAYQAEGYFVKRAGDQVTGDLTMYTATSSDSPAIIFQRGTLTDSYNDWRIINSGGKLYFGQRGTSSSAFDSKIYLDNNGGIHATSFEGNATSATKVGHTLTFGDVSNPLYSFDGSADVNVPLYNGATV